MNLKKAEQTLSAEYSDITTNDWDITIAICKNEKNYLKQLNR